MPIFSFQNTMARRHSLFSSWAVLFLFFIFDTTKCASASSNDTCPAVFDQLEQTLTCSNTYAIDPSALLEMASTNETLRQVLTQRKMPQGMKLFEMNLCKRFDVKTLSCTFEKFNFLLMETVWPYLPEEKRTLTLPICGAGYGDSKCDSFKYLTSSCGNITSIRTEPTEDNEFEYIYYRKKRCDWQINVGEAYVIKITVTHFKTRYCLDSCDCDYLKFFDVINGTDVERGTYCGRRDSWEYISMSNTVKISFQLHGFEVGTGFNLVYQTIPANDVETFSGPVKSYGLKGSIETQNARPTSRIGKMFIYKWLIRTDESRNIQLRWNVSGRCSIPLNVFVYDGPTELDSIITNEAVVAGNLTSGGFQILVKVVREEQCQQEFSGSYTTSLGEITSLLTNPNLNAEKSVFFGAININNGNVYDFNFHTNENTFPKFQGIVVKGPVESYVAVNISEYEFNGPSEDDCSREGMVMWDGLPEEGAKYGPFCSGHVNMELFSVKARRSKELPVIHSSAEVFTVLFYSYAKAIEAKTSIKTNMKLTDCVGIYDWYSLKKFSFLNADYKNDTTKNEVKVTLNPDKNSCFQLQKLPSKFPVKEDIIINILPTYAYNKITNVVTSDPHMGECRGYVSSNVYEDGRGRIKSEMDCLISPLGFIGKVHNTVSQDINNCIEEKLRGKYKEVVHFHQKDAICGSLLFHEPHDYSITLRAPFDKYKTHHYVLQFNIADLDMPVYSDIKISEYWAPSNWLSVPNLVTSQLPLTWLTSWSWKVSITVKCQSPYVSMKMNYQLVQDGYPKPDKFMDGCPQNFSDSTNNYRYKEHCYSVITHPGNDRRTWNQAEEHCQESGGHLLTINQPDELEFIKGLFKDKYAKALYDKHKVYYIGLKPSGKVSSFKYCVPR